MLLAHAEWCCPAWLARQAANAFSAAKCASGFARCTHVALCYTFRLSCHIAVTSCSVSLAPRAISPLTAWYDHALMMINFTPMLPHKGACSQTRKRTPIMSLSMSQSMPVCNASCDLLPTPLHWSREAAGVIAIQSDLRAVRSKIRDTSWQLLDAHCQCMRAVHADCRPSGLSAIYCMGNGPLQH